MTTSIFFLSNGYKGGANKYIYQNLNFISKKKQSILIDKIIDTQLINKSKKIKYYKLNLLKNIILNHKKLKKILINNKREKNIIFLTNFVIYLLYFCLFYQLKKKNFKIILTIHSGIFIKNLKNNFLSFCFSLLSLNLDKIIFGSESSKNWWFQKYFWMRLINHKIIYNGIKQDKFNLKKKSKINKLNISFVGRIVYENNPELFLKVVQDNSENKKLKFHCFGEGPLKNKINDKNITFHGWCNPKIIYKKTDLILITSKINNFPYVALEAKTAGIPVISTSKGDIKKIIFNNSDGFLINKFDLNIIKKKILYIMKNYNQFSRNAKKNSKVFDENTSLNKIWKFIFK